jgi:hypothetical protein
MQDDMMMRVDRGKRRRMPGLQFFFFSEERTRFPSYFVGPGTCERVTRFIL